MSIENMECFIVISIFAGNSHHVVEWTEDGDPKKQSIHGCENEFEAISAVLSTEIAEQYVGDSYE